MKGLDGKFAIVTGAGGAIGRAIALRLAEAGAVVGVLDKNEDGAHAASRAIVDAGGRAHPLVCDITDYAAVKRAVAEFEKSAGPTDVLVNCAGWDRLRQFLDTDEDLWERLISINLKGPIHVQHAVARGMAERKSGRIVNIASDAGRVGSSGEAVYAACKGGVIALTKALARELAGRNVSVNAVCPGPTDTPILRSFLEEGEWGQKVFDALKKAIPMRRLGEPEDVAGIVAFLASDEAKFITGQVISVSGGLTMHG
jgi:2-hydroxycyclohexanecarboxyl-CoA dehydrogenase